MTNAMADFCEPDQTEYFLCKSKTGTAVLCGQGKEEPGKLKLNYSFEKNGKTELLYPDPKGSSGKFLASEVTGAHGGILHVAFKIGAYKYILEERYDMQATSEGAIYVLRDDKVVRRMTCAEYPTHAMHPIFKKNILPEEGFLDLR